MGLRGVGGWMSGVRRFVVHEHFALRAGLHYDLRLKWGGFFEGLGLQEGAAVRVWGEEVWGGSA
jgi:hypothetical protein